MPSFEYTGRDVQGGAVSGTADALSMDALATQLLNSGITPIEIQQQKHKTDIQEEFKHWWNARKTPELDDLILFARQFYTLQRAGVPIIRAITGLADTTRNLQLKESLHEILNDLEAGRELSSAMVQYPKIFSPLFVNMVKVGESTGRLDVVFLQIADYLEREKETNAQIKAAMRYPSFVLIAITAAMVVINIFVIPTFAKVFAGFGAELPLATRILMGFSDFMVSYWPHMLVILIMIIIGTKHYVKTEAGEYKWDKYKLRIPIIGSIILRATLSRYARSFAMSMRAGVPLVQALILVSRAVDNTFIGQHVMSMRNGIERGDSLTRTASATEMFTPLVIQMMSVGEETGAVDDLLEQVAEFYDREVDFELKSLTSKIEPILIIAIAGMVLVLALGVFLPMWDLIGAAK